MLISNMLLTEKKQCKYFFYCLFLFSVLLTFIELY